MNSPPTSSSSFLYGVVLVSGASPYRRKEGWGRNSPDPIFFLQVFPASLWERQSY